ncbi:hypothetical protein DPMN_104557 [Dreissena polymorpha]|uniref:EGF-like domain-containing protein n=1 Tax=Dreissena polymorpha TaxID=45954 RepID=A0A9D4H806_DREPO|nr:hypothetical protein DPMN_104557 [Dreissena polymorpha]
MFILIAAMRVDINECATSPCKNGATCNNLFNNYTCTCAAGWQGASCDKGSFFQYKS